MLAAPSSYSQSCSDCIQIPRSTLEQAKKAADEVKVSRPLIESQANEIKLLTENGELKGDLIVTLKENIRLKDRQLQDKEDTFVAERAALELTEKQLKIVIMENAKLKRSNRLWRKVGTFAGAAAAVLGYALLH